MSSHRDPTRLSRGPSRWTSVGAAALLVAATGCGGSTPAPDTGAGKQTGSGGKSVPAPGWFHTPPKSPSALFFVGDSTGAPDESTARELAAQKAMAQLTVYCGATVSSEFNSQEREAGGKYEQVISMTVDIAGDEMTIREAVVKQSVTGKAGDGTFTGFALIEWPKAQYEQVLVAQKQRAARALELYLKAEASARENDSITARTNLREAKSILGPMKSQVPLTHQRLTNSSLLWDAMEALDGRLRAAEKERGKVFAVAVDCVRAGKADHCPGRAGAVRQAVSSSGLKVSADRVPASVAEQILASGTPEVDAALRSSGHVLAVRYLVESMGTSGPFSFMKCGARAVVFNTSSRRIVKAKETKPIKEGHPQPDGAVRKACDQAEKNLMKWLAEELATHSKAEARSSR